MDIKEMKENRLKKMEREEEQAEEELHDRYMQLGKDIYEITEREAEKINSLTDRIIGLKRSICEESGRIECSECLTMNSARSLYCHRCGAKLNRESKEENNRGK